MSKLFIPVILGTARDKRRSEEVAKFVFRELGKLDGIMTELVDVRDFPLTATIPSWVEDSKLESWRNLLRKADGLVIVSPEYNRSIPGELKLLLDSAYVEYEKKPAAICGVSNGPFGGSRMIEALRIILTQLGLVTVRNAVLFTKVGDGFDEKDYLEPVSKLFQELVWYVSVLKEGRERNAINK